MCTQTCRSAKRDAGRKRSTTTVARHGRTHLSQIGRQGFLTLAPRLGGGEFYATADAVALLAERGALVPYR